MRHKELTDSINGSILKKDYLEAFLMQSAYLEAVLKYIADYNFFISLEAKIEDNPSGSIFYGEIRENFNKKSLYELTSFLYKVKIFDKELYEKINKYREKRNKILHDLVTQLLKDKFEQELEQTCSLGNLILSDKNFAHMIKLIEEIDSSVREQIEKAV